MDLKPIAEGIPAVATPAVTTTTSKLTGVLLGTNINSNWTSISAGHTVTMSQNLVPLTRLPPALIGSTAEEQDWLTIRRRRDRSTSSSPTRVSPAATTARTRMILPCIAFHPAPTPTYSPRQAVM